MLPVHVISLAHCAARRQSAARQLAEHSLPYEFFDALGSDRGKALFSRCDVDAFVVNTGRRPVDGELGCFASHKALWQRIADEDRAAVIMEDDFRLRRSFAEALRATRALIHDVGFLRLQEARRARTSPVARVGAFNLERYTKPPNCAMSYAIAPTLARRLLEHTVDFLAPVDVVLRCTWEFGQPMYCLKPYPVAESEHSAQSVIGERHKCRKPLSTRLRRCRAKTESLLRRQHFNLTHSDRELRARISRGAARMSAPDEGNREPRILPAIRKSQCAVRRRARG